MDDDDDDETCTLFIETDVDDIALRAVDLCFLYLIPIAVQIFCYVKVARKLWSSQVYIILVLQCSMYVYVQGSILKIFGVFSSTLWHFVAKFSRYVNAASEIFNCLKFTNTAAQLPCDFFVFKNVPTNTR